MPGLHGVAGTLIPLQRGASIVGYRPFATHHEQAMARPRPCVVKAVDKLAVLKELLAVAFLVDCLTIEHGGTQVSVE